MKIEKTMLIGELIHMDEPSDADGCRNALPWMPSFSG